MNVDTLAALLQTQKQKQEIFMKEMTEQRGTFEQEMSQKRVLWKQEQHTTLWKEQEIQQKKLRQREEEEYIYKRDLERQKELDQYLVQKQILEKELIDKKEQLEKEFSEREKNIVMQEQEFQHLKVQAEEFPESLQQAISNTEKTVTERLLFKYDYETKLTQKEVEGERRLHQQIVMALEATITQQEQQIRELTEKTNHAGIQVQEIAVRAIEGASRQRLYHPYEKSSEATKT